MEMHARDSYLDRNESCVDLRKRGRAYGIRYLKEEKG